MRKIEKKVHARTYLVSYGGSKEEISVTMAPDKGKTERNSVKVYRKMKKKTPPPPPPCNSVSLGLGGLARYVLLVPNGLWAWVL